MWGGATCGGTGQRRRCTNPPSLSHRLWSTPFPWATPPHQQGTGAVGHGQTTPKESWEHVRRRHEDPNTAAIAHTEHGPEPRHINGRPPVASAALT